MGNHVVRVEEKVDESIEKTQGPDEEQEAPRGTQIQSVARAARLLLTVAEHPDGISAKELAFANDLTLPTTYPLLNTLVSEGMLAKSMSRQYALGAQIGTLAEGYLRRVGTPETLLKKLQNISAATGETVYLSAWHGDVIRVLSMVEGRHAVRVANVDVGTYDDAHARAAGKLLLAFAPAKKREAYLRSRELSARTPNTITDPDELVTELDEIRVLGYATDREEYAEGATGLALPVFEGETIVAALSVAAPSGRFARTEKQIRAALEEAAGLS
jgi:IclR family transcriptional regulator, acetate operon repressor